MIPRTAVKALERILRHIHHICEFSWEPGCVLRYSRARSKTAITLTGGDVVQPGDPILELHFWNDRLGRDRFPGTFPMAIRSAFRRSLELLAEQLQSNEHFADIKAVHATLPRMRSRSCRVQRPFGFSPCIERRSDRWRVHDFFENFLIHSVRWAFNTNRASQRPLRLSRLELWFSVSDLTGRFGAIAQPDHRGLRLPTHCAHLAKMHLREQKR
jgi:hypothetical protein